MTTQTFPARPLSRPFWTSLPPALITSALRVSPSQPRGIQKPYGISDRHDPYRRPRGFGLLLRSLPRPQSTIDDARHNRRATLGSNFLGWSSRGWPYVF